MKKHKETTLRNAEAVKKIIKNTKGKIFSVSFIKKDGSERTLVGRIGVTPKESKNTGRKNPIKNYNNYVIVYDMKAKEYRNVNTSTVTRLKANGVEYKV